MTTLAAGMFNGSINPGQLAHRSDDQEQHTEEDQTLTATVLPMSIGRSSPAHWHEYDIDFNTDGTITVAHTGGLATDGTDTIRNVEVLDFTDQDISLQAPTLDLHGDVTSTSTVSPPQAYRDTFDTAALNNSNGTVNWAGTPWVESNDDSGDVVTGGQIQLDNGTNDLRFMTGDGASITRTVNLCGLTTATLSFDYDRIND